MDTTIDAVASPPRPAARARPITRIDRAAVRGLLVGSLMLLVGWIAQGLLGRRLYLFEAGGLLLLTGVLFYRVVGRTIPLAPTFAAPPLPRFLVDRTLHRGAMLVVGALALNLLSLGLFTYAWTLEQRNKLDQLPGGLSLPWLLYLASIPIALVGVYVLDQRPSLREMLRRNRLPLVGLGLILVVAAVLRLMQLGSQPFGLWFDEARDGLETLKIMNNGSFRPVYAFFVDEPAMKLYLTIPFFWLLGPTELALRLPTALAGIASVAGIYIFGRALFNRAIGLTAAGIVATMSWHLTFSRIAFNAVYSVGLDAAAFGLLVLGLARGRRMYFALAGLALGFGLNFYYTSRLAIVAIGLYLLHRLAWERAAFLRQHLANLIIFATCTFLVASPLGLYAVEFPKEFSQRTANASIQREIAEQNSYQPLFDNIRKHLLMFNVQGDPNGRHNLPGAPMLERGTAVLGVFGLVMAFLQARRRAEYFALATWFVVAMLGGILSLNFEAPQSLRSADEIPVIAVLAALPLVAIAGVLGRVLGNWRVRLGPNLVPARAVFGGAVVGIALAGIGTSNYNRYFVQQAGDFSSWNSHSTAATVIGRMISRGQTVGRIYLDEPLMDQPSILYLAPSYTPHVKFDPVGSLPLRDPAGATIFLQGEESRTLDMIRRMYPDAQVEQLRFPGGGPAVLYTIRVSPKQVTSVEGLTARFWPGEQPTGDPAATTRVATPDTAAAPPSLAGRVYEELKGVLVVPQYGPYQLKLDAPSSVTLRLDETDLLSGGGEKATILPRGNHALSLAGPVDLGTSIRLLWRTPAGSDFVPVPREVFFADPVTSNGLLGSYFNGATWSGQPGLQQIDPSLQLRVHILPLARPYTVEWRGKIYIPNAGAYRFGTQSRDGSWLFLDEKMVVDNGRGTGDYVEGAVAMTQGFHDIRVRFLDETGHTFINTYWTAPGRPKEPLPDQLLFPPQGSYPDRVVLPAPAPLPEPAAAAGAPAVGSAPGKPAAAAAPSNVASRAGAAGNTPALTANVVQKIGGPGDGPGQFGGPRALGFDADGNLYVGEAGNHRVQKIDKDGNSVLTWGNQADLADPGGIAVDSAGRVVVLESNVGWIKRFGADGKAIDQFAGPDARFYHPRGMAIDAADNLYIADTGTSRVVKFNGRGEQVQVIGTKGKGQGQLGEPTGVAVGPTGGVWVADSANAKVVRFDKGGAAEVELPIAKSGSADGPHIVALNDGTALVTDPEAGNLLLIGPDGNARGRVAVEGLKRPVGIAIGPDGRIAVGDIATNQVLILAPLDR